MFRPRATVSFVVAAIVAATSTAALGSTARSGPLTGTWGGFIAGSGVKRQHMLITLNAAESGGTWTLGAACHGALTLDSISGGYHHYLRHLARGSTCGGGDIDCLKRVGANVYDAVTPHKGGEYDVSGTLYRVRAK